MNKKTKAIIIAIVAMILAIITALYFNHQNSKETFNKQNIQDIEETTNKNIDVSKTKPAEETESTVEQKIAEPKMILKKVNNITKSLPQKSAQPKRQISNELLPKKTDTAKVKDIQIELDEIPQTEARQDIVEFNSVYKPNYKKTVNYQGVNYVYKSKVQ